MEFDLSIFLKAAVSGVPLTFVVLVLVWVWGNFGAKGKVQLASSMLTGLVLGMLYMVNQAPPPVGVYPQFQYWFGATVYGLGLGGLASVTWELSKDAIEKAVAKFLAKFYGTDGLP